MSGRRGPVDELEGWGPCARGGRRAACKDAERCGPRAPRPPLVRPGRRPPAPRAGAPLPLLLHRDTPLQTAPTPLLYCFAKPFIHSLRCVTPPIDPPGIVLLKNEPVPPSTTKLLPLNKAALKKVCVVGPLADATEHMVSGREGGGQGMARGRD